MDMHKGQILVESEGVTGKGCTFSIILEKYHSASSSSAIPSDESNRVIMEEDNIRIKNDDSTRLKTITPQSVLPMFAHSDAQRDGGFELTDLSHKQEHQQISSFENNSQYINLATNDAHNPKSSRNAIKYSKTSSLKDAGCVLIVDDSNVNSKMLANCLKHLFHEIKFASDGLLAIEAVKISMKANHAYDFIFMDYEMPNMNGVEATRQIRALGYVGPIIGITGHFLPEQMNSFRDAGATEVLVKPVNIDAIQACITGKKGREGGGGLYHVCINFYSVDRVFNYIPLRC